MMQFSRNLLQTLEREEPSIWKKRTEPLKNKKLRDLSNTAGKMDRYCMHQELSVI